jgi:hypothetical protein
LPTFPSGSPTSMLYTFHFSHSCAACPAHLILSHERSSYIFNTHFKETLINMIEIGLRQFWAWEYVKRIRNGSKWKQLYYSVVFWLLTPYSLAGGCSCFRGTCRAEFALLWRVGSGIAQSVQLLATDPSSSPGMLKNILHFV